MHAQNVLPLFDTVSIPLQLAEPEDRSCCARPRGARFVRSVASEAGVGSFACLKGASGRRYVFSAVSREQLALYANAVVAIADGAGRMQVVLSRNDYLADPIPASRLYVHLLDNTEGDAEAVIADLDSAQDH